MEKEDLIDELLHKPLDFGSIMLEGLISKHLEFKNIRSENPFHALTVTLIKIYQ